MLLYSNSRIIRFEDNTLMLLNNYPSWVPVTYQEHLVRENETLMDISRKFFKVTWKWYQIAELNDLADPLVLNPGDVLQIPNS